MTRADSSNRAELATLVVARQVVAGLQASRQRLATAESLTGGLVASAVTAIPGASTVFAGGVVAYTVEAKTKLLGVPADLIDRAGVVSEQVAVELAAGVRASLGSDWGIGTTGAAGPQSHGEQPPGTVWVAVAGPDGQSQTRRLVLPGDRAEVRLATVRYVLGLLEDQLLAG